ncbi:hypothetical protein ACFQI3_02055 [Hansschlegelia quercus]|uniref:Uncharacterized protein n=1 Tax=Hansschlegelia quercus TaxID=2528245 RepID=A0A4Q9GMN2_9HYPH|nr:hypothetical protein [Hansschlegelia quercus]TBN54721.1 hypothetical protein EYR15_00695 [Hansschlegelia quercus]
MRTRRSRLSRQASGATRGADPPAESVAALDGYRALGRSDGALCAVAICAAVARLDGSSDEVQRTHFDALDAAAAAILARGASQLEASVYRTSAHDEVNRRLALLREALTI